MQKKPEDFFFSRFYFLKENIVNAFVHLIYDMCTYIHAFADSLRNTVLDDESLTTIFGAAPSEPSWSNRLPPSMMQPKPSVSPTVSPSDTAAKVNHLSKNEFALGNVSFKLFKVMFPSCSKNVLTHNSIKSG